MSTANNQTVSRPKIERLSLYTLMAICVLPFAILSHELGHFVSYLYFGAEEVRLLAFSVSAETKHLAPSQLAIASMIGPLISYFTIALCAFAVRTHYRPFWILLGLSAPIGRIVNAIYIYFRVLGYHPNPNFDEFNFCRQLNIEPLVVAVPTMLVVAATFIWFGRLIIKQGGLVELIFIVASISIGLTVWSAIGPMLVS